MVKANTKVSNSKADFYHNVLISFHVYSYNLAYIVYIPYSVSIVATFVVSNTMTTSSKKGNIAC